MASEANKLIVCLTRTSGQGTLTNLLASIPQKKIEEKERKLHTGKLCKDAHNNIGEKGNGKDRNSTTPIFILLRCSKSASRGVPMSNIKSFHTLVGSSGSLTMAQKTPKMPKV
jgi:hypothetical protein